MPLTSRLRAPGICRRLLRLFVLIHVCAGLLQPAIAAVQPVCEHRLAAVAMAQEGMASHDHQAMQHDAMPADSFGADGETWHGCGSACHFACSALVPVVAGGIFLPLDDGGNVPAVITVVAAPSHVGETPHRPPRAFR